MLQTYAKFCRAAMHVNNAAACHAQHDLHLIGRRTLASSRVAPKENHSQAQASEHGHHVGPYLAPPECCCCQHVCRPWGPAYCHAPPQHTLPAAPKQQQQQGQLGLHQPPTPSTALGQTGSCRCCCLRDLNAGRLLVQLLWHVLDAWGIQQLLMGLRGICWRTKSNLGVF
jgi:hypothetical protein